MGIVIGALRSWWWRLKRRLFGYPSPRQGVVNFEIQKDASLQVYWKDVDLGRGPGAALYVRGAEILRFDCFGAGKGHYHVHPAEKSPLGPKGQNRLHFFERTIEEQVERAVFEITRNAAYYLERSRDPRVQRFRLQPGRLEETAALARDRMLQYTRNEVPVK